MAPSIQNRFGLLQDLDSPNTEDSTRDGFTAFVVPKNRKKNRLQLAASANTSGWSYDLEWKIDSCVTGVDVSQVQPQVVDQFGVVEEMRTKKTHVVRSQKPLIPVLNYEKIRKVQEEKKMKFSSVFDPKIDYISMTTPRMSIFEVLVAHVPSGNLAETYPKCEVFCKTGVLEGIGKRLYWQVELRMRACCVDGAVFLEIDEGFVADYVKNHNSRFNLNSKTFKGKQFPKDITHDPKVTNGKFLEYRTVVTSTFPSFTVLSTGEIDAADENYELVEIKSQKEGLSPIFWRAQSCKLFLQMFFSEMKRCVQGNSVDQKIVDIEELELEEIVLKGGAQEKEPWFKEDVLRFIDAFLIKVVEKVKKSPKIVFNVTKEEGISRLRIKESKMSAKKFFPESFAKHFKLDLS